MLRAIILIIILLLVLSFFGVSVQHIIESPTGQANFGYVGDLLSKGWNDIVTIVNDLWNSITHLV